MKKLGPLGLRLIEGLRGPALHIVKAIKEETLSTDKGPEAILQALVTALRLRRQQRVARGRRSQQAIWRANEHLHPAEKDLVCHAHRFG